MHISKDKWNKETWSLGREKPHIHSITTTNATGIITGFQDGRDFAKNHYRRYPIRPSPQPRDSGAVTIPSLPRKQMRCRQRKQVAWAPVGKWEPGFGCGQAVSGGLALLRHMQTHTQRPLRSGKNQNKARCKHTAGGWRVKLKVTARRQETLNPSLAFVLSIKENELKPERTEPTWLGRELKPKIGEMMSPGGMDSNLLDPPSLVLQMPRLPEAERGQTTEP